MRHILFIFLAIFLLGCGQFNPPGIKALRPSTLPLDKIKLPEGFQIATYAEGVKNARSMALSPSGTLFVGTRGEGSVYALKDIDGNGQADTIFTLATKLKMPNGVAFRDGDLYVAEVNRVLKYENIEANLANPPEPVVVYDQYPTETHHGWKFIAFGPDGKLYIPVGAPCNICESEDEAVSKVNFEAALVL
jgi:glucose/arabinose dehydrogenase